MASGDLTTIDKVRDHLGLDTVDADAILSRYITSSSRWALSQIGRNILSATYTETYDGDGSSTLLLSNWPVQAVTAVSVDGDAITARATVDDSGYVLRPDAMGLDLVGYYFNAGTSNVVVTYRAGYEVTQAATIPAVSTYTVTTTSRYQDAISATLTATGVALTETTGTPATGQYAVSENALTGVATYTFHADQAGLAVSLVYATVPDDLEQAVIEHVALRYKDRGREGLATSSGMGESVSFVTAGGTIAYVMGVLDSYREVGAR